MDMRVICFLGLAGAGLVAMPVAHAQQGTVEIYPNTDFPFNDIAHNDDANTVAKCVEACRDNEKCVAFTLSPEGTCYLKESASDPLHIPHATSGFITTRGVPPKHRSDEK